MMKCVLRSAVLTILATCVVIAGEETTQNTRQSYSGKFGFYQPSDGLNNGLLFGVDGITEFLHYRLILTGAIDLYPKQSIDIFRNPQPDGGSPPDITQQQMILLPLHANVGYKLFDIADADSRGYVGVGGGYYFYFYSSTYRPKQAGGILPPTPSLSRSESKNGGGFLGTVFARVLINKIFIEPRFYFASRSEDEIGGFHFLVNPSGLAITIGIQSF